MSVEVIEGDCLEVMRGMEAGSVDSIVTDPPYGCGKSDWDTEFPVRWYSEARRVAHTVVIITGSAGLADSIPLVGDDFVDVVAAWNTNGMTRGPLGFGNWLAAVVAGEKPPVRIGQNVIRFSVGGEKPPHPSPKPLAYMCALIERLTVSGSLILDPFGGSGTTGVAAVNTGRDCILIEKDPEYCEIARKRIMEVQILEKEKRC